MDRKRVEDLQQALASFPWMDPHTHIDAAHLSARGLDDILLYHMAISDLYAAGCPSGGRIEEDRTTGEARRRIVPSKRAKYVYQLGRAHDPFRSVRVARAGDAGQLGTLGSDNRRTKPG